MRNTTSRREPVRRATAVGGGPPTRDDRPWPAEGRRRASTGAFVRFLRAILVPEDDTSFYQLEAASADAVRDAMTRPGLRSDQITGAVSTETDPFRGGIDR